MNPNERIVVQRVLAALEAREPGSVLFAIKALRQLEEDEARRRVRIKAKQTLKVSYDRKQSRWVNVTAELLDQWTALYPGVCVEVELLLAAGWLQSNPSEERGVRWMMNVWLRGELVKRGKGKGRDYSPWFFGKSRPEVLQSLRAWLLGKLSLAETVAATGAYLAAGGRTKNAMLEAFANEKKAELQEAIEGDLGQRKFPQDHLAQEW